MGKAERTRQFIIEQAAPIFNEKGIAGTTIDDILVATKMAKGGLYGHFTSKEEISHAMVDHLLAKLSQKVSTALAKEKTAVKKIYAFLEIYKNPLTSFMEGGCPILNFGVESDDTNPVVKEKVKAAIERSQKAFTGILREGIENKELSDTLNPADFALKMFAMLQGGMMISKVLDNNKYMHSLTSMIKNELKTYELK